MIRLSRTFGVASLALSLTVAAHALAEAQAQNAPTPAGPRVTVTKAVRGELVETVAVTGTLVARDEVLIGPEIDGFRLVEILAEEGDRIEKGQVLARLSRETLDAQLAQNDAAIAKTEAAIAQARNQIATAEASLRQSRQALERTSELKKSGFASQAVLDQQTNAERADAGRLAAAQDWLKVSQADRASMEAHRRELLVRLGRTEVKAPAAGLISRRAAKLGAVASMSAEPMFRLIANGQIELEGEVPELRIGKVQAGQAAVVTSGATSVPGTVRLVSPEVDRVTRQGKVRIAIPDPAGQRIGSFARGLVETRRVHAVSVPQSAVLYGDQGPFVQVVEKDRIVSTPVKLGIASEQRVEVLSGLKEDAVYVIKAGAFLRDGDAVSPVEPGKPQADAGQRMQVR